MNSIKVSNGYIKVKDDEAEELLETLMDKGVFWEYVSIVFNSSVKDKDKYLKQAQEEHTVHDTASSEALGEMMKLIQSMQSQLKTIETKVDTPKVISSPVTADTPNASTKSATPAPPKRKKKKVDPAKMNLGGNAAFAAMASKMKQFEK